MRVNMKKHFKKNRSWMEKDKETQREVDEMWKMWKKKKKKKKKG